VSPIFGLAGASGSEPSAAEGATSELRAPWAASDARSCASGTAAGRPFVGSNIREIPSKGRAGWRRGWHLSSCTVESGPSGARGQVTKIDCESMFFVVSFADLCESWGDGTVGDSEKDEASYDRDS
jgi:hypothetical protein